MTNPTVYLVIGPSAIAFEETGEILETVDWNGVNEPIWDGAGICDYRGGGGQGGFRLLHIALTAAEQNAAACGFDIQRIPREVAA
jgi:hypothetical protein